MEREGSSAFRKEADIAFRGGRLVRPEVRFLVPLRPGKMFGGGFNFAGHLEVNPSGVLPEEPFFFSKLPSSVMDPG